jgi:NAD(P)-dependent dehydrogenase (short-subunit alcohol dehydrogenase family)
VDLSGVSTIVTGGASGLGAATARALAAAGAQVAIIDVDGAGGAAVAAEVGAVAHAVDVTDETAVRAALGQIAAAHGPARIVVSCAGVGRAARIIDRDGAMPLADFSRTIAVNLIGTFNVLRLSALAMQALPALRDDERGVIVMTASIAAFEGQMGQAAYAASKGGVASLTLPAAREFARHGIRVVSIAPGLFATPMLAALPDPVRQSLVSAVPFPHRLGAPEEFARLVLHVVDNPMLNGVTLRLDGALRLAAG